MHNAAFKGTGLLRRRPASAFKRHRHRSLFVACLGCAGKPDQLALVINYAAQGLALQALDPPERDDQVIITLSGYGTYQGVVRWRSARSFGVRLTSPLDVLGLSLARPGPHFSDYPLHHSAAFEGLYLHAAFRHGSFTEA
jgi:hypothetical protein